MMVKQLYPLPAGKHLNLPILGKTIWTMSSRLCCNISKVIPGGGFWQEQLKNMAIGMQSNNGNSLLDYARRIRTRHSKICSNIY